MNKHIGEQYGHFEIVSRDTSKSREYYFIKCLNCGKIQEKSVRYDGIKNHSIGRKCICDKDLTGEIFGFLKVIDIDYEKTKARKDSYYFCKCLKCNRDKLVSVRGSYLKNGATKSCGCLNDESHRKDIRGQVFNNFIILDVDYEKTYNEKRKGTGTYWKIKCQNCGQERSVSAREIFQNKIPICFCENNSFSKGENKIYHILNSLKINFKQQKKYEDLRSEHNVNLRFDFFLEDYNTVIEYQGIQHYEPVEYFGGLDNLIACQQRDTLKRQYCNEHNIKLIEIPYWDYDKLNEAYILELL